MSHVDIAESEKPELEQLVNIDAAGDLVGNEPSHALHERNHALVRIVVARNDPDHAKRVHDRRDDLCRGVEVGSGSQILEMALERREKLDIVLGLGIESHQIAALVLKRVDA